MKLGRLQPTYPPRRFLRSYFSLQEPLPASPSEVDYGPKASIFLADVLGNDTKGDCTVAAAMHVAGMLLANAGQPIPSTFSAQSCLDLYFKLTGGEDSGLDEVTVLRAWQSAELLPAREHKIEGWVGVNGRSQPELRFAQWAFGNLYFALAMPSAWIDPFPRKSGFVWDLAGEPDAHNGHAFCGTGYTSAGVRIDSWGLQGTLTWGAIAKYFDGRNGQTYTVLSRDALDVLTRKTPSGFDLAQLSADLVSGELER